MTLFRTPAGYMQLSEISEMLKCSTVTIWKYRQSFEDFPAPVRFRRRLLFERSAVMAWCRQHLEEYHDGTSQELTSFDQEFASYERDCMAALRERCQEVVADAMRGCDTIREQMSAELTAAIRSEAVRCLGAMDLRDLVRKALEEALAEELSGCAASGADSNGRGLHRTQTEPDASGRVRTDMPQLTKTCDNSA